MSEIKLISKHICKAITVKENNVVIKQNLYNYQSYGIKGHIKQYYYKI